MRYFRLLGLIVLGCGLFLPQHFAQAQAEKCGFGDIEVGIPGTIFGRKTVCQIVNYFVPNDDPQSLTPEQRTQPIRSLVGVLANIFIGVIVVAGLIMSTVAGYIYMTAGGNAERVGLAKKMLVSAVAGIVIALTTFIILNTINPALVN